MVNIVADGIAAEAPAEPVPLPKGVHVEPLAAPAALPSAEPRQRMKMGDLLPMVAVMLAVFATTLSAVGLAMTSRTVAEASRAIEDLRHAQREITALRTAHPEPASVPTQPETQRQMPAEAQLPAPVQAANVSAPGPADVGGVSAALERLRTDIAHYQAQNGGGLVPLVRNGQTDLANRLGEIAAKVDRIDRAIGARHGAVEDLLTPSPAAPRAAGRGRSS